MSLNLGREGEMGMIVITSLDALPEYCYECPCCDNEYGDCKADKQKRGSWERPHWCPLKYEKEKGEQHV